MLTGSVDERLYSAWMSALAKMNRRLRAAYQSRGYRSGVKLQKLLSLLRHPSIRAFGDIIKNRRDLRKLRSNLRPFAREKMELPSPNYFSEERIAVYTCIFGKYDAVQDPVCVPDNVDYYMITDMELPVDSIWRKVDLSPYDVQLSGLTDVEKNRWFKMHPHLVFDHYRYSVYIDGNIIPVTDFTALVNRIGGSCGVAMFWHRYDDCVYQEALYNRFSVKKIPRDEVDRQVSYLRTQGMPENYGMTTCNVIARDHDNVVCKKLMDDWWTEFISRCRRDQLSFPYVAWKNGVAMGEIATLGSDVWEDDALIVVLHEQ